MSRHSILISLAVGLLALPLSWVVADLVVALNSLPTVYAVGLALGVAVASWAGLVVLWKRRDGLGIRGRRGRFSMSWTPILVGVVGSVVILVALFPTTCTGTLIGASAGSPDPNQSWCKSVVFRELGTIRGGSSETVLPHRSSWDVLTQRLTLTALVLSSVPLVGGAAWSWASQREHKEIVTEDPAR